MLKKFYFTFGQNHTHRIQNFTFDCDVVCCIPAETMQEARSVAFEHFGDKFATSYTEEQIKESMHHFPRGVKTLAR